MAAESSAWPRGREASPCRSGLFAPSAWPVGRTATHEVDVRVVVPPSGRVLVKVWRTGADVVLVPEVMVVWKVSLASAVVDVMVSSVNGFVSHVYHNYISLLQQQKKITKAPAS